MKKIQKLTSLALALVLSLALCVPAFAAGPRYSSVGYDSRTVDGYGDGYTYKIKSTIYVSDRPEFRACVWVNEYSGKNPPKGSMQATAILCDQNGKTLRQKYGENNGSESIIFPTTDGYGGTDAYAATGWVKLKNGSNINPVPGVNIYGQAYNKARLMSEFLNEDGGYAVNAQGETYGSALLAEFVGEEPSLISAIGIDGIEGYIRFADLLADNVNGTKIPLYDQEGAVIGSFQA